MPKRSITDPNELGALLAAVTLLEPAKDRDLAKVVEHIHSVLGASIGATTAGRLALSEFGANVPQDALPTVEQAHAAALQATLDSIEQDNANGVAPTKVANRIHHEATKALCTAWGLA